MVFFAAIVFAQDGKIVQRIELAFPDSVKKVVYSVYPDIADEILALKYSRITYLSDGLKVTAFLVEPATPGKYPCIISNRGGNRSFGEWTPLRVGLFLGQRANWGYVVVATQYRGVDGGEGVEEFGGKEINDVLNLIPALAQVGSADTSRIGIEGTSRVGMMAYLALKRTCRFKAAAVTAGLANAFKNIASRPEMEQYVLSELIPNYEENRDALLKERSAVFWTDQLCKTTPLLVMHGSADWRVLPVESVELVNKLLEHKHPTRFILFEGADHGISEYREERLAAIKRHFDYYVRDRGALPDMEPHGR